MQQLQKQINGYEAELAELRDRGSSMSKERSELRKEMDILKETLESEEAMNPAESKMKTRENEHIQRLLKFAMSCRMKLKSLQRRKRDACKQLKTVDTQKNAQKKQLNVQKRQKIP